VKRQRGITVIELLVGVTVAIILAIIAVPLFGGAGPNCDDPDARQSALMRARIAQITGDIGKIHMAAGRFELSNGRYPANLAETN
jgi:Tfp pilus assembly protein PilE